ncbi:LysE family translocator [Nocardioides humilatus]|uniref:LysE family translocator n=1 Tax=Nocardioides humilatus TaxID=2607660 RepID=A0A5B1LMP0_9ACTN|nr:LysE family translocator [Nocardioides humilatus]KAA1420907.1 LysE family translocator [Nocardioides humilatus]
MPSSSQWLAFLVASILFIQVPGPSLLFTIGRALTVGRRDALLSVVGNGIGLMVQVALVAVGLGAVVAASASAYTTIKLIGAAYVIYLGVQAIRHRGDARLALEATADAPPRPSTAWSSVRTGVIVGATNPKTIVFFVAFLPQFTSDAGDPGIALGVLGLVFGAMAITSDSIWALAASKARDWFSSRPQRLDRLGATGGLMMVGLGTTMVLAD